jgi:hypothetical protein
MSVLGHDGVAGQGEALAAVVLAENLPEEIPRANRTPKHTGAQLPRETTHWDYPQVFCSESWSIQDRNSVAKDGAPGKWMVGAMSSTSRV